MQRRYSTTFYDSKDGINEVFLWESAKYWAANKLSKGSEDQSIKVGIFNKLLCRPRTSSVVERVNEQIVQYLDLASSSPLIVGVLNEPGSCQHQRKLAVSERTKFDREMVHETIMYYQQGTLLKQCKLL